MGKKYSNEGRDTDNVKHMTCLNSILEEGTEAITTMKPIDADEGSHFLPQASPNKKPPGKVTSQKGYIDYTKRTSLLSTINKDALYINTATS